MPHFLPGQNTGLGEWLKDARTWIPAAAARGGVEDDSIPEYRSSSTAIGKRRRPDRALVALGHRRGETDRGPEPKDGEVHVLPVQGNVYMLVADGTNITGRWVRRASCW